VARQLFARLSVFGCGAVVAIVAVVALEDVQAARVVIVHTCADADGTLRVVEPNMPCAPEQRRVRLQLIREEDDECKEDDGRVERLERRLRDLEARDRRGTLRGRRVHAPFEVVMAKGEAHSRLLHIEQQNVVFYNGDERPVAWIRADVNGGLLVTESVGGDRTALIAAQGKRAHVLIKENNQERVDLGRRENGRYNLQVFGAQNKLVAGIGQSKAGPGLVVVADAAGIEKASLFLDEAQRSGRLEVANSSGTTVGAMAARPEAGFLQLKDSSGTAMVYAGINGNGAGVVNTGPDMRGFGVGLVGLVPSMILGKP
jgi:hypothetical protein